MILLICSGILAFVGKGLLVPAVISVGIFQLSDI